MPDYQTWIAEFLTGHDDRVAADVWRAIECVNDQVTVECVRAGQHYIVIGRGHEERLILNDETRQAALVHVREKHMDDMDPEMWEDYCHLRDKDRDDEDDE